MRITGTFTIDVDLDDTIVAPDEPVVVPPPVDPPEPPPAPFQGVINFDDPDVRSLMPSRIFPADWSPYKKVTDAQVLADSAERINNAQSHGSLRFRYEPICAYQVLGNNYTGFDDLTIGPGPDGEPDESFPADFERDETYKNTWPLGDHTLIDCETRFFDIPLKGAWTYVGPPIGAKLRQLQETKLDLPNQGGGSDRHAYAYRPWTNELWEFYKLYRHEHKWYAGYAVRWDCTQSPYTQRKDYPAAENAWGHNSADASGMPIMPLVIKPWEWESGEYNHAIRITVPRNCTEHLGRTPPAVHAVQTWVSGARLRMGERLRLRADYQHENYDQCPPQVKGLLKAMQEYGVIVADIGSLAVCMDWSCGGGNGFTQAQTWMWQLDLDALEVVENP
jgi:hypothetical protein